MNPSDLPLMKFVVKQRNKLSSKGHYIDWEPVAWTFAIINVLFLFLAPFQALRNFEFLLFFAPLWLPLLTIYAAANRVVQYRRAKFLAKQKYVLLELRLPRETKKTPLAMELFFSNMHFGPGESTNYKVYKLGNIRPWWSVEIVSLGGQVHFYIWTREAHRRGIESYLYSQYPDMEIIEAEDYSLITDPSDDEHKLFGEEFIKSIPDEKGQPDPYPIKTYIEYGLDKAGTKPEEQIDPLAQVIELLGSLGPKEQFWIQIMFRITKKEKYNGEKDWKKAGQEEIAKIREATRQKSYYIDPATGKKVETDGFPNPTKGQLETIADIERNINKPGFDVGIRTIYSGPKDSYQGFMSSFVLALWKPFANETGASLKQLGGYSAGFNDYPWEDPKGLAHDFVEKKIVKLYRRRAFFNQPYQGPWSIMSSEELATLFHIPSSTINTPGLPRIQSTTRGAPTNLPV